VEGLRNVDGVAVKVDDGRVSIVDCGGLKINSSIITSEWLLLSLFSLRFDIAKAKQQA